MRRGSPRSLEERMKVRAGWLFMLCLAALSSGIAFAAPGRDAWTSSGAHSGIAFPIVGRSLAWIPFLGGAPSLPVTQDGVVLSRSERFDLVGFDVHDHGLGVYLDV